MCGVENSDIVRKFFLSQQVTEARSRCQPGSLLCLCMADSVSKSWVEVTLCLKPLFKAF